ncbi:MAG: HEAT repeat domain-containing protein [Kofleriaceae bacterium]
MRTKGTSALLLVIAMLMGIALPRVAFADNVDSLIRELDASSERVRLSAVLNLTKLGDVRGIDPLVKVIANDSDKKVRSAAAVGLGVLGASASKAQKAKALAALQKASTSDASEFVKAKAEDSLKKLGSSGGGGPTPSGGSSIYVNIGPMSSKTGNATNDTKFRALIVKTAGSTLARSAPKMEQKWPGTLPTSVAGFSSKGYSAFFVDGTLNELKVQTSGKTATVSCKISMLLASFPDKSIFGMLNGGAKVQGSASQKDVDLAGEDCVIAVVEDLIAKKIVPTINSKVSP